jgi:glycosidase
MSGQTPISQRWKMKRKFSDLSDSTDLSGSSPSDCESCGERSPRRPILSRRKVGKCEELSSTETDPGEDSFQHNSRTYVRNEDSGDDSTPEDFDKEPPLKKPKLDENMVRKAVNEISNNNTKVANVAKKFQIPISTLYRRVKRFRETGSIFVRGKVFTKEEEEQLISFINSKQKGTPVSKAALLNLVNEYLKV